MKAIDRRNLLRGILCVSIVASVGLAMMPKTAHALPLAASRAGVVKPEGLVEKARVTIHVHPRRHHRCWWHRGRRVCGWR